MFEFILDDGTARLHCRWWNLPFMRNYFSAQAEVIVFSQPTAIKPRTMDHPETEVIEDGEDSSIHLDRLVPVYPLTEGLCAGAARAGGVPRLCGGAVAAVDLCRRGRPSGAS